MKVEFQGIKATAKYLTVYMAIREETWVQFATVKVPMTVMLSQEVTDAMDSHVRRHLIQIWSEVDLADPLF